MSKKKKKKTKKSENVISKNCVLNVYNIHERG